MESCVHRIEVHYSADPRIKIRTARIRSLGFSVDELHLVDVYTLVTCTRDFSGKELSDIGAQLINPVVQKFLVDTPTKIPFDYAIEVGFLPGVTDNVGATARQTIEDFFSLSLRDIISCRTGKTCLHPCKSAREPGAYQVPVRVRRQGNGPCRTRYSFKRTGVSGYC